ncbi:MAG: 2-amino-4-hydroxy-6-hydroxymethyldihydropteridine diphosphokinase [Bacillota bacterium]
MNNNRIYIGLGSNLGDAPQNLATAVRLLKEHFQTVITASSVYYSEPVEVPDQPWFYNQAAFFEAGPDWSPTIVLRELKTIEAEMGREPSFRYGPRLIDLDLLFYRNWVYECQYLSVPHPKITERLFVLAPLLELTPDLVHPRLNISLTQIILENSAKFSRCQKTAISL